MEELEHALARGAKIYAEILGYGLAGDASHLTAPSEDGSGAFRAMRNALQDAGFKDASQVSYVNAHATSTPLGDAIEVNAIGRFFDGQKCKPHVSSMKGALGHGQGAAGAVETCLSVMALYRATLPPNLNLFEPDPGMLEKVIFNSDQPIEWPIEPHQKRRVLLKNSFGFGGTNASLCLASYL